MGRMHCLARVIVKLAMMTGWKSSIFGYMSSGDSVPLVITTLWNISRTNQSINHSYDVTSNSEEDAVNQSIDYD